MSEDAITVRPLRQGDHDDWRRLWTSYLEFYETRVDEAVYLSTWRRLFEEGEYEPRGMLAISGGRPVGLIHYIMHRSCWSTRDNCYLQDLYTEPDMRGKGVRRALIEAVGAQVDQLGAGQVYWLTHQDNATARRLYDRVARNTGFIRYSRP